MGVSCCESGSHGAVTSSDVHAQTSPSVIPVREPGVSSLMILTSGRDSDFSLWF